MEARLVIIIVNFRTAGLTIDCLRSLEPEVAANPGTKVIVVDNGSGDDSAAQIVGAIERGAWRSWCELNASDKNWGFAGGNNRGFERILAKGGAEFYLLLNSDTIVREGCLSRCLRLMESDPTVGLMSCRLLNADGTVQNACRRFPSPARCLATALSLPWRMPRLFSWADCHDPSWDRNTVARDVDWVLGAFMFVRGDWVAKHGPLDERFFFYGEDVEFCHRIWRTGFRCRYDPSATIVHLGGSSSDPSRMAAAARNVHMWRGRYLAQRLCYGRLAELFLRGLDLANVSARIVLGRVRGRRETPGYKVLTESLGVLRRNWNKWGAPSA
jgi:GT2 family glycosyltransferase